MLKRIVFYPFLIGMYPFLALLGNNLGELRIKETFRSGIMSLTISTILFLLLWCILHNITKAGLLSSFWLIFFYSYGHIYRLLEGKSVFGIYYGRHMILLILWFVFITIGSWFILNISKELIRINFLVNVISIVLVLLPTIQIGGFFYQQRRINNLTRNKTTILTSTFDLLETPKPDIYFIVLDGYSRADVINELYGLDISPFINILKHFGFVIIDCAQSNYGFTGFSMMATLNMEYVNSIYKYFPLDSEERISSFNEEITDYIIHSQVRQELENLGYETVAFESSWNLVEIYDADQFITVDNISQKKTFIGKPINNYEDTFLYTTLLRFLIDGKSTLINSFLNQLKSPNEHHYELEKYKLDELINLPKLPGNKFIFFHLAIPHRPFVFDQNGNFVSDDTIGDNPGYTDQIIYLNKRLLQIISVLLSNSTIQPIIIIQGDHGWDPRPQYRMKIFSAYYLPDGGNKQLYQTITPINNFRLILDYYFDKQLGLIQDRSYYSLSEHAPDYGIYATPFKMIQVPENCPTNTIR